MTRSTLNSGALVEVAFLGAHVCQARVCTQSCCYILIRLLPFRGFSNTAKGERERCEDAHAEECRRRIGKEGRAQRERDESAKGAYLIAADGQSVTAE